METDEKESCFFLSTIGARGGARAAMACPAGLSKTCGVANALCVGDTLEPVWDAKRQIWRCLPKFIGN